MTEHQRFVRLAKLFAGALPRARLARKGHASNMCSFVVPPLRSRRDERVAVREFARRVRERMPRRYFSLDVPEEAIVSRAVRLSGDGRRLRAIEVFNVERRQFLMRIDVAFD